MCHGADDGDWQFLTGGAFEMADSMVAALKEIVHIDPSICELADLPEGWKATREFVGGAWQRAMSEEN